MTGLCTAKLPSRGMTMIEGSINNVDFQTPLGPDQIQLGFYNGSFLDDPQKLLSGSGQYVRFIRVFSPDDIKPELYSELIKQAVVAG